MELSGGLYMLTMNPAQSDSCLERARERREDRTEPEKAERGPGPGKGELGWEEHRPRSERGHEVGPGGGTLAGLCPAHRAGVEGGVGA